MKSRFFLLPFCLAIGSSAQSPEPALVQESNVITGSTSLTTDDLVELLQLTVLKCEFVLPERTEPGQGYFLEYWVEDWRRNAESPTIVDELSLGLGKGGESQLLVKFPDSHSLHYSVSSSVNASGSTTKLTLEDRGARSWHLLSNQILETGKPILIALRIDGMPHPSLFPNADAPLPDVFKFYRDHESIQIVAFYIRIKEFPEKAESGPRD